MTVSLWLGLVGNGPDVSLQSEFFLLPLLIIFVESSVLCPLPFVKATHDAFENTICEQDQAN